MVRSGVEINYPGLLIEPLPSGAKRFRVRPEGNPKQRIRIHCGPERGLMQNSFETLRTAMAGTFGASMVQTVLTS